MTYSIIARDPQSGELGVAVQSHWFSAGSVVPWARPGVGAVATQANGRAAYGPEALALMAGGLGAAEALSQLVAADPGAESRQVAVVDAHGQVAVHTGSVCIPFAGHVLGDGVSCQANIMASEAVWPAMMEAFAAAAGPLADRLLAALDAAEAAGGDIRGRRSAALLVVPAAGDPWEVVVSVRVDDHPEPLHELRRLRYLRQAYTLAGEADELLGHGHPAEAAALFRRASELAPGNHELLFWRGIGMFITGDVDAGLERLREAIALQPGWARVLPRLPAQMVPDAAGICERLGLR